MTSNERDKPQTPVSCIHAEKKNLEEVFLLKLTQNLFEFGRKLKPQRKIYVCKKQKQKKQHCCTYACTCGQDLNISATHTTTTLLHLACVLALQLITSIRKYTCCRVVVSDLLKSKTPEWFFLIIAVAVVVVASCHTFHSSMPLVSWQNWCQRRQISCNQSSFSCLDKILWSQIWRISFSIYYQICYGCLSVHFLIIFPFFWPVRFC